MEPYTPHDLYRTLGCEVDATLDDVRRAYRRLAVQLHPDKSAQDTKAQFAAVTEAYDILSDPRRREVYDAFGLDVLHLYEEAHRFARTVGAVEPTSSPPRVYFATGLVAGGALLVVLLGLALVLAALHYDGYLDAVPWWLLFLPLWLALPLATAMAAVIGAGADTPAAAREARGVALSGLPEALRERQLLAATCQPAARPTRLDSPSGGWARDAAWLLLSTTQLTVLPPLLGDGGLHRPRSRKSAGGGGGGGRATPTAAPMSVSTPRARLHAQSGAPGTALTPEQAAVEAMALALKAPPSAEEALMAAELWDATFSPHYGQLPGAMPPRSKGAHEDAVKDAVKDAAAAAAADWTTAFEDLEEGAPPTRPHTSQAHDSRAGAQYGAQPKNWMQAFDDDDEQSRDSGGALEDPPSDWEEDEYSNSSRGEARSTRKT
ncbi:hypothetical protein Ctob_014898 [Chrysochromulina tobinii]|uniref:J domain-containing protein n=1 Tax=Chrysochromulina tobinii TaxID=1460289 RepID=A0A0M0LS50_9EUKA|nr:hypothetical protein Ctob_014898 [Chrysochromulina tobinii]|eukprot:KOO53875.1 hypothetical protein Ctob_014898 [Chrysochromulina sp. CCMP291]